MGCPIIAVKGYLSRDVLRAEPLVFGGCLPRHVAASTRDRPVKLFRYEAGVLIVGNNWAHTGRTARTPAV